MTSSMTPGQMAALLRTGQERLADELSALPADLWGKPSPCAGWTLATVVAHLAIQGQIYSGFVRMSQAGRLEPPPPLTATNYAEYYAQRDALIAREAERTPAEILDTFRRTGSELVALVASLTDADLEKPTLAWGGGTRPLRVAISGRLFEVAVHHWDVRRSLGPEARIPADFDRFLAGHLRTSIVPIYRGSGDAGPIRVELVGPVPAAWLLSVDNGKLTVTDAGETGAAVTVRTDPQTLALVTVGRLKAGEVVPGGLWEVRGDAASAQRLFAGFSGY